MNEPRPWYREPETFIAVAALIVSVSAVAVGLYEAQLQRAHDRAEVWPHVEISTYTTPQGASLFVENTGIGPAIIKSIVVTRRCSATGGSSATITSVGRVRGDRSMHVRRRRRASIFD